MKIANADKLKKHFENVVDVKLFTAAEICTIIDTFSAEVTEGRKYVFSYDYDGTPIITDLDAKQEIEEGILGTGIWKRHDEWRGGEYIGGFYHVGCLASDGVYIKWPSKYCPNCGKKMDMSTPKDAEP